MVNVALIHRFHVGALHARIRALVAVDDEPQVLRRQKGLVGRGRGREVG